MASLTAYGGTEGLPLTWRMRVAQWLTRSYRDRVYAVARHTACENARLVALLREHGIEPYEVCPKLAETEQGA